MDASLLNAWRSYAAHRAKLTPAAESKGYCNVYSRGYLLTKHPKADVTPSDWVRWRHGDWSLTLEPGLQCAIAGDGEGLDVVVLGHAFDSGLSLTRSSDVAAVLLHDLKRGDGTWASVDKSATWLGGRFVILAFRDNELRVHVDATASLSCYWGSDGDAIALSSHSTLAAEALGTLSSDRQSWIMKHPEYVNPGGKSLPGLITPHDAVLEVFANCVLSISATEVRHERFFPSDELESMSIPAAADVFMDEVRFQTRSWLESTEESWLALTAGGDSRTLLSLGLDLFQSSRTVSMTYHFFERNTPSTMVDLLAANELAVATGLRHRALDLTAVAAGSPMASLYSTTFPTWARFPSLAQALYNNLPANATLFLALGGEIGTVFYKERGTTELSPALLAKKFAYSDVHKDPILIDEMERYMEYTNFSTSRLSNLDFYDVFYWEHRLTKWAALGYSEYDLGPVPAIPMNSRRAIMALLSVPFQSRLDKEIYRRIADISGIR